MNPDARSQSILPIASGLYASCQASKDYFEARGMNIEAHVFESYMRRVEARFAEPGPLPGWQRRIGSFLQGKNIPKASFVEKSVRTRSTGQYVAWAAAILLVLMLAVTLWASSATLQQPIGPRAENIEERVHLPVARDIDAQAAEWARLQSRMMMDGESLTIAVAVLDPESHLYALRIGDIGHDAVEVGGSVIRNWYSSPFGESLQGDDIARWQVEGGAWIFLRRSSGATVWEYTNPAARTLGFASDADPTTEFVAVPRYTPTQAASGQPDAAITFGAVVLICASLLAIPSVIFLWHRLGLGFTDR